LVALMFGLEISSVPVILPTLEEQLAQSPSFFQFVPASAAATTAGEVNATSPSTLANPNAVRRSAL
ncbi:MFS transporter, partial [Klebsiella pneumoniae]|nr:MFS transporter [Klebsiella pneumoniae]